MSKAFLGLGLGLIAWGITVWGGEPAVAQDINWRQNYDAARKEAREKNLFLVIDFGTENCVWCQRLEATTFRDPGVVEILSKLSVPVKVDGEKYSQLVKKLKIQSYPTLILAAPNGKIIDVHEGYIKADAFRGKLQKAVAIVRAEFPPLSLPPGSNSLAVSPIPTSPKAAVNPIQLTSVTEPAASPEMEKRKMAQKLLAMAEEEYRTQQFLCCLTRCKVIAATFPTSPEAQEARNLATKVKSNPEHVHLACERLTDTLCELYLTLADHSLKLNQPREAVPYLQWIVQVCPNASYAETARELLEKVKGQK
jgi:hypothetical protein